LVKIFLSPLPILPLFLIPKPKQMETVTNDVSQDVLSSEYERNLVEASKGKRFANLLIDVVLFYVLFTIIALVFFVGNPEAAEQYAAGSDSRSGLLENLIGMVLYVLYFFAMEALFKGKTIGKFITGTRAVYEHDGSTITGKSALTRALSRIVPFEAFSALFGRPWHDSWTDTIVIDEKESHRG
jgi:uncharacterized RDD family membrane protein YckC